MSYANAPSHRNGTLLPPREKVNAGVAESTRRAGPARQSGNLLAPKLGSSVATTLTSSIGACAIAHWYMIPGREVWREYVRFLTRTLLKLRSHKGLAYRRLAAERLTARDFLACDFLWRNLRNRNSVESYLDVGSPWVLPLMTVRRLAFNRATLLVPRGTLVDHMKRLFKWETSADVVTARSIEIASIGDERGPFDIVTSINWFGPTREEAEVLPALWSAVKPGGVLLLSLPCARSSSDEHGTHPLGSKVRIDRSLRTGRRVYDEVALAKQVYEVLGEPKRHEIYGENTAGHYRNVCRQRRNPGANTQFKESLAIGRDWSRFARVDDLPGQGLIAMKFVKAA